ncbi:hypothetical protein [Ekhidna sp. To15]|uniref:hypothetical protein n=1 Tax=Ekhidna sp. To15 TaxID=3395267 RepID=UPI003F526B57
MKKLILIALAYSLAFLLYANNDGETRTATVKTTVTASDVINIEAKHTELLVETWDKNEVEIEASIRFDGKMTNKMEVFLDEFEQRVKDNISQRTGELKIDTDMDIPNRVQIGGKSIGINISYGGKELKIVYKIKAPGTNKYIISNSYEDVRLFGSFNEIEFDQYSGDLEAGTIKTAKMNLKYGSASIKSLENGDMEIYEQELDIYSLGSLELNAKYSDLEFEKVGKVDAISYESDFEIGSIEEFKGNFKYGEINISGKLNVASFECYEMDIEAEELGKMESENSKYSKYEFGKARSIKFEQSYEDETTIGTLGSFQSKNSKYGKHTIDVLEGSISLNAYEDKIEIDELGKKVSKISIDGKYIDTAIGIGNSSFILSTNIKYGEVNYDKSDVDVRRYIKDGDQLEVEVHSKSKSDNPIRISVKGYEVNITLN